MSTGDGMEVGYWLSSEEHGPQALVTNAKAAEDHGFEFAMISDHLHPWVPAQGHGSFVWGVLGAIAQATDRLHLATGVTAPIHRIHPVVVAHAAATAAVLLEGRFALGLGSGERLNEHVVGGEWPRPGVRRRMLAEAVDIIKQLFAGDDVNVDGDFFTVEHAQLWSRPSTPPPIWLAVSGARSAKLAGEQADGMLGLAPQPELVSAFETAGGTGKPRVAQMHVCWAATEAEARRVAHRWWPNGTLPSSLLTELSRPSQFEDVATLLSEDDVAGSMICGPDAGAMVTSVQRFGAAGFTRVYVHQVGPDQVGFMDFWAASVRPRL